MERSTPEKALRLSTDELDSWLAEFDEHRTGGTGGDMAAPYVAAAAVLSSFDPATIRAPDQTEAANDQMISALLELSTPLRGSCRPSFWQLKDKPRQIAIERLGSREELRKARRANPATAEDPLQKGIDLLLNASSPPVLDGLSLSDLLGLQRAQRWFGNVEGVIAPDERQLVARIERERILQPMRRLLANGFVGRAGELAQLKNYVGVLPPERMSDYFRRLFTHVRYFMKDRPPLFLHGPGGVGKSTLLAQFIVEHADPSAKYPMPFIYLDFDRASLDPRRQHTLMFEAVAQIEAQFPDVAARTDQRAVRELATGLEAVDISKGSQFGRFEILLDRVSFLIDRLADINGQPVLLVLDTFEEAQTQGESAVSNVWHFLQQLLERVDRLRIVVAGRADLASHFSREPIEIRSFDQPTAVAFLRAKTRNIPGGPLSDQDAKAIFDLIKIPQEDGSLGAVPLSLALAARIVVREGLDALKETVPRRSLFTRITAEQQQGFLNTRVLQHLHTTDGDIEKIVAPGLLVRRITPDIIQHVLAGPCGIELTDRARAHQLFAQLAQEVGLVDATRESDALWHVPYVRRTMLFSLRSQTDEAVVQQIHDNAVAYYEGRSGDLARAEEIYHRLCRGDPASVLEARWSPALVPALRGVYEETEGQARLWLAGKLNLEVDAALRAEAGLVEWEKQAELRAHSLLDAGLASEALAALRERSERSLASALPPLEADALLLLNRPMEARNVIIAALQVGASSGREDLAAALLLRLCTVEERRNRLQDALLAAEEALRAARTSGDFLTALGAGASVLRLRGKLNQAELAEVRELRCEMVAKLQNAELRQRLRRRPVILRELAAELHADMPDLVADALELLGIDREGLGRVLGETYAEVMRLTGGTGGAADTLRSLIRRDERVSTAGLGSEISALIRRGDTSRDLVAVLGRALSANVESGISQIIGPQNRRDIVLSQEDKERLRDAIVKAFTPAALEELVYLALDENLYNLVPPASSFAHQVYGIIRDCERHGNLGRLLSALRKSSGHPELSFLATRLLARRSSSGATSPIDLNDLSELQQAVLIDALVSAFGRRTLDVLIGDTRRRPVDVALSQPDLRTEVLEMVRQSQMEGWTDQLVEHAQQITDHPGIRNLIGHLQLLDFEGDAHLINRSLEQTIKARTIGGRDFVTWRDKLIRLWTRVCRIEVQLPSGAPQSLGTGFLVGPDLVLTNYHVIQHFTSEGGGPPENAQLACRFDYGIESGGENPGLVVPVAGSWLADYSLYHGTEFSDPGIVPAEDELDYALIRLGSPVGTMPSAEGSKRGWIITSVEQRFARATDFICVIQSPLSGPMKIAVGTVIGVNPNGTRIRYDTNTEPGSSGSPCFDANLELVALHHAAEPGYGSRPTFNQGIPIDRIIRRMATRQGVPCFWEYRDGVEANATIELPKV
jgi:cellulose synthase operon protein C